MTSEIIRVLLPKNKIPPLDYIIQDQYYEIGQLVMVPFKNKLLSGIIWKKIPFSPLSGQKIKNIKQQLDFPILSNNFIKLLEWVSNYTLSDIGSICKLVIPNNEVTGPIKLPILYKLAEKFDAKITKNRAKVIEFMNQIKIPIAISHIVFQAKVSYSSLINMKKLGILEIADHVIDEEENFPQNNIEHEFYLSEEQRSIAEKLKYYITQKKYKTIVLDGITGSGKTEIFFEVIRNLLLSTTGQALILVPEILLTTQLIQRFKKKFGFLPAIWHSEISEKNKQISWQKIAKGETKIVIGTRSALFLPFLNLKFIVVDEEHESSYKQEEGVIYNARDIAVARGFFENILVLLASATPSIETLYNVKIGKYEIMKLNFRFGEAVLPRVRLVDLRQAKLNKIFISPILREAIIENYKKNFQTILFLNRRGYAPLVICSKCGETLKCNHCSTLLIFHKKANLFKCHQCSYNILYNNICPECKTSNSLIFHGPGVERIIEELKTFIPEARTAIVTRDTVNNLASSQKILSSIEEGKLDIIVGTQMIAKGHNFPKITLVGVIDTDFGLSILDLRAAERTYQLLNQVSGRAGRDKYKGQVILQTYNPNNPALLSILDHDRNKFVNNEIENRKLFNMPPFSKLTALIIYGPDEKEVYLYAENLRNKIYGNSEIEIFGPIPAPLSKIKNNYRYRILIKSAKIFNIQKHIKEIISNLGRHVNVRLKIDIDPYNFL